MAYTGFFNSDYLPPTAFYFRLKFNGTEDMDSSFQEVSGLKLSITTDEKKEGGNNTSVYHLPNPPKYENLVLKRCLMSNSKLDAWCKDAFEMFTFEPKDIEVALLSADGTVLAMWNVFKAYPISWELSNLNSTSNQLAIETLTLKYLSFRREVL